MVTESTRRVAGRRIPRSRTDTPRVHALLRASTLRISAGPVPMPLLRMGRGPVRGGPVHVYPVRSCGLGLAIDRALRDVVDHRGQVVRFDLHHDVPEWGPRGEVHHPDKRGLLVQAHDGAVSPATREKLPSRRIADPLISNPFPEAFETLRRPGQSVLLGLDSQIRKEISKCRGHRFERLRRATCRFDPNPEHISPIRHTAFNFLDLAPEGGEGFLWTSPPWGPGCARSFWHS